MKPSQAVREGVSKLSCQKLGLGFTDPNNFSTTFKELYGMPPSMYMKEQLSKKEE